MRTKNAKLKLIFVYGTLQITGNYYANILNKNGRFISRGKVKGELYDLGNYPGAVLSIESEHYIYGSVFELEDPDRVLKELDYYEGIGSPDCEYTRDIATIETESTLLECWIYLHIADSSDKFRIVHGDYLTYLNELKK